MSEVVVKPVEGKPGVFADADGKTFIDQKLADSLIAQRIGEEKAKLEAKSGDAIAQAEAAKAEAETALSESKAKIAALETAGASAEGANKALEDTFAAITSGMTDDAKKLIPDYGTTADKIKFINKNAATFFPASGVSKPTPPQAPPPMNIPPGSPTQTQAVPSWQEILKDPKGAAAKLG